MMSCTSKHPADCIPNAVWIVQTIVFLTMKPTKEVCLNDAEISCLIRPSCRNGACIHSVGEIGQRCAQGL
jgi:hypothetical protein